MDPKRTDYSLRKPSRTGFSLGMDDYAARTRGTQASSNPAQTQPVQDSVSASSQATSQDIVVTNQPVQKAQSVTPAPAVSSNVVDGFSRSIKPKAAIQKPITKLNFKAYISQMMNAGLHNPGYLAMSASITAIKGFLVQPRPVVQSTQTVNHANPKLAEAMDVGKLIVEQPEAQTPAENIAEAPASAMELATASLKSEAKLNSESDAKKHGKKIAAGEHLKNLSLKAKTNRHKIRSIVAASVACGIILVSSGLMYANSKNLPEGSIAGSTSLYVNQTPKEEQPVQQDDNKLQPGRLRISSLNVDAPSVIVGLTRDNAVDVPEKISDAAWFNGSALPGKPGTTFMLGHYAAGYGGIFDNLAKIKDGDIIEVSDQAGDIFKYKVTKREKQKVADINMDALLTSDGDNRLIIMTCAGSYIAQNYTDRFIVTATPVQ
jgi:LPXTG-site transpeptidase (sortase) family protein